MRKTLLVIFSILTVSSFNFAFAATKNEQTILVKAEIFYNGKLLSRPQVLALMNQKASIQIGDEESKLDWQVTASESTLPQAGPNAIELNTSLEYTKEGHTFKSAPRIIVKPGEEASIQVGNSEGNTLEIKVTADRK
tara:strand:+ start:21614 stop:22024 length:411 start_codon:yes stop_codon:yes gene_type:complete